MYSLVTAMIRGLYVSKCSAYATAKVGDLMSNVGKAMSGYSSLLLSGT